MADSTPAGWAEVRPLIMTAFFDARSFAFFDRLRQTHFPPDLNVLSAHLTLFHHLPGTDLPRLVTETRRLAAETPPLRFRTAGTRLLGRGVAIAIDCPPLSALRGRIAALWQDALTAQDRAGFRPHVTIQNKASAAAARALAPAIEALLPIEGSIEGLALDRYIGGPWEPVASLRFEQG